MSWFKMMSLIIICIRKCIKRGNKIYIRLILLLIVDFAKSTLFRISVLPALLNLLTVNIFT